MGKEKVSFRYSNCECFDSAKNDLFLAQLWGSVAEYNGSGRLQSDRGRTNVTIFGGDCPKWDRGNMRIRLLGAVRRNRDRFCSRKSFAASKKCQARRRGPLTTTCVS